MEARQSFGQDVDKIADETVGTDEASVLEFLQMVNHPAVSMDSIMG